MRWIDNLHGRAVRSAAGRAVALRLEWLRYALTFPGSDQDFWIVTCARNPGGSALRCLDSVHEQKYDRARVTHLFIDDASTDTTEASVREWMAEHPGHSVQYVRRDERRGGTANTVEGFRAAPAGSIVVEVNGDDWLPDDGVLSFYNKVYADQNVWMTYNTLAYAESGKRAARRPVPRAVVRSNGFREYRPWITQHLHTFRRELFGYLREDTFIDPDTDGFWASADDQAIYLAMLELAGSHSRHIYRTTYVYDKHAAAEEALDPDGTRERAARIRRLEKYRPLGTLWGRAP